MSTIDKGSFTFTQDDGQTFVLPITEYVVIHPETGVDAHFDDKDAAKVFADGLGTVVFPVVDASSYLVEVEA